MDTNFFIENIRKAFGQIELPIVFWYSNSYETPPVKTKHCFIEALKTAREGGIISLDANSISCPGGKTYTGFAEPAPFIPEFVSNKEKYKQTPEQVTNFINNLKMPQAPGKFIHFSSIELIEDLSCIEGLIFFATPDILTGLVSWTFFDSDKPDAVSVPFGSGCSTMVSQVLVENKKNGHRTFMGMFDPSVRKCVEENILSFSIPLSRFKEMYHTLTKCCLIDTNAWNKVKERINK